MEHVITIWEETDDAGNRKAFLVGAWPDEAWFSRALLACADLQGLSVEGDLLRLNMENATALYRMSSAESNDVYVVAHKVAPARAATA